MQIECDPVKDAVNTIKHGISLLMAESFDIDTALIEEDKRRDYNETPLIAMGLLVIAFM